MLRALLPLGLLLGACRAPATGGLPDAGDPQAVAVRTVLDREYRAAALDVIERAEQSIDLMQFGFAYGPTVKKLQDALGAAVERGVRVRVLLDEEGAGSMTSLPFLQRLGMD